MAVVSSCTSDYYFRIAPVAPPDLYPFVGMRSHFPLAFGHLYTLYSENYFLVLWFPFTLFVVVSFYGDSAWKKVAAVLPLVTPKCIRDKTDTIRGPGYGPVFSWLPSRLQFPRENTLGRRCRRPTVPHRLERRYLG